MPGVIRKFLLLAALVVLTAIYFSAIGMVPYPIGGTTFFALVVLLEVSILLILLGAQWPLPLWGRAAMAALLFMIVLWVSAQDTLGAPMYVFIHQMWLVGLIVACGAFAIWNGVTRAKGTER